MESLFDAALNGVAFSSIAEEVILTDIVEEAPRMDTQTAALALRDGLIRTHNRRRSLAVRLVYVIRTQDVELRSELRDKVAAWAAKGGDLTINTRPRKRLRVVLDTSPALGSGMRWTEELSLTLTAYAVPYWEDAKVQGLQFSTVLDESDGQYFFADVITPKGNASEIPLMVLLQCTGESALTALKIVANETVMEFSGLNIAAGKNALRIDYDENGLLNIWDIRTRESLMKNRIPASSDDLLLKTGESNQITIYSDQPVVGEIAYRGRWV